MTLMKPDLQKMIRKKEGIEPKNFQDTDQLEFNNQNSHFVTCGKFLMNGYIESYKDYFSLFMDPNSPIASSKPTREEMQVIEKILIKIEEEILNGKFHNALTLYSNLAEKN